MWEWFTTNSIWILLISALILTVLLFARQWFQERIQNATKTLPKGLHISATATFWIIGGITLIIIALAVTAITLDRQGIHTMITPETIKLWLLEHGISIIIIVILSYLVYQIIKLIVPHVVEGSVKARGKGRRAREELAKRSQTLAGILTSTIGILLASIATFMVLSEVGVNITPLLAGAGVAGLAIGFGAQYLIRDLISGIFILLEDQYNKGDVVKVAGTSGIVEEVNLRRTVIRDLDGIVHSVPNGEITTASNYTKDWSRVNLDVPVAYGEDLDHVIEVLNKVGNELAEDEYFGPKIRSAPQVLRVNKFADSAIEIKVLGETKPLMQWEVTGELRKRIKKAFDEKTRHLP